MNAGFRNLLGRRDTTRFKAYILAIAVQMLVLPATIYYGFTANAAPAFYPWGATLGGFLFGIAMNWGGGCAAGVWYKLGAGNLGALLAIIATVAGYVVTEVGVLQPARLFIQSFGAQSPQTVSALFHLPLWIISTPLAVLLIYFLRRGSRVDTENDCGWIKTGVIVGGIGVAAWLASSFAGRDFGMAIMPGNKDAFELLTFGKSQSLSWDLFFVMGIPLGGFLAVSRSGKRASSTFSDTSVRRLLAGGFVLGVSASIAGGCTVGHGLTGVPLLSFGSIVFTIFAILGAWAGLYFEKK